ncbi:hypothetical protein BJ322DRAFT_1022832 [Thelephora terrestris]|uniref:Uncharacterized protein n=1 Tax=Thelephora terrestris TaxID=56493 RepID=A0A9P6H9I1_9AGAM|nr:hypothetical protein BJ322DRAFT_1022832 [Thelephora terrestris]
MSGCRDVAKGDKKRGKCSEAKGQRILIGTVENAEGSHLDLAQRLSIVERRSRFRIVSEIRSRHRTATADPNEGFTDLGFRDFIQASRRVSRRKLACIETNPYATELLNRGVEFVTETNETFNSVLEASVIHTGNVGSMLMDEIAHVNERVDGRREEIEKLEKEFLGCHEGILKIEDEQEQHSMAIDRLKGEVITLKDLVRLTRRVSELTGEVRDLQRRCNEPEVRVEEEGLEVLHRARSPIVPNQAESPPACLLVRHENRLVPIDDEVIEIGSDEFYQNVGVVRRDTPRPEFVSTPWGSRRQWPALEYDPYAEFVPDSEPNSDTELPDYDDLSDVDPNEIREQNWLNEELSSRGNGGPGRGDLHMRVRRYMFTYYTSGLLGYLD